MDVRRRLREAGGLTPTEQQLASTIVSLGPRLQDYSIKELAQLASCSVATVHRLCRKLGLEGFKELKVQVARAEAVRAASGEVDINFPFGPGWDSDRIAMSLERLYRETLSQTRDLMGAENLDRAAEFVLAARQVDVYTESHNLYPANMFVDRMLSIGREATCHESVERQVRTALASDGTHVALAISYSGAAGAMRNALAILAQTETPVILVGTPDAVRRNPGLDVYLRISDAERYQGRITQFASHLAVHYVLDTLFSCVFARDWERSAAFLEASVPYTRKPGLAEGQ